MHNDIFYDAWESSEAETEESISQLCSKIEGRIETTSKLLFPLTGDSPVDDLIDINVVGDESAFSPIHFLRLRALRGSQS